MPRNAATDTSNLNSFGVGVDGRRQWSAVGVNGGRAFTNDIQLDGLPVMGGGYNEAAVVPNTEGLQEVRNIITSASKEAKFRHIKLLTLNETFSRGKALQVGEGNKGLNGGLRVEGEGGEVCQCFCLSCSLYPYLSIYPAVGG